MRNAVGGVEALLEAEPILEFLLGAFMADEFFRVGVVPPREADFSGRAVGLRLEERRGKQRKLVLTIYGFQ